MHIIQHAGQYRLIRLSSTPRCQGVLGISTSQASTSLLQCTNSCSDWLLWTKLAMIFSLPPISQIIHNNCPQRKSLTATDRASLWRHALLRWSQWRCRKRMPPLGSVTRVAVLTLPQCCKCATCSSGFSKFFLNHFLKHETCSWKKTYGPSEEGTMTSNKPFISNLWACPQRLGLCLGEWTETWKIQYNCSKPLVSELVLFTPTPSPA